MTSTLQQTDDRARLREALQRRLGDDQHHPVSSAQLRLWVLSQLQPDATAYNLPIRVQLEGRLDVDRLALALQALIRRQAVLRTRFRARDGVPEQIVGPALRPDLTLAEGPAPDSSDGLPVDARAALETPFDLEHETPLRLCLWACGAQRHELLIVVHHIATDGWSHGIMLGELAALYDAMGEAKDASHPPLALSYADYARWETEWLEGTNLSSGLDYWQRTLSGARATVVPSDFANTSSSRLDAGEVSLRLDAKVVERLRGFARERGATFFMALLSCAKIVFGARAKSDDVVVGTDVANRIHPGTESLIGFFVNQLVLRTSLHDDPSYAELIERVRDVCLEAYDLQSLPYDRVHQALRSGRNGTPLFSIKVALLEAPRAEFGSEDLNWRPVDLAVPATDFDLFLSLWDLGDEVLVKLVFDPALYRPATARGLVEEIATVCRRVGEEPERRCSELTARSQPASPPPMLRAPRSGRRRVIEANNPLPSVCEVDP